MRAVLESSTLQSEAMTLAAPLLRKYELMPGISIPSCSGFPRAVWQAERTTKSSSPKSRVAISEIGSFLPFPRTRKEPLG